MIDFFKKEDWEKNLSNRTFATEVIHVIASFGQQAVAPLDFILYNGEVRTQMAVLETLAKTADPAAGKLILDWLQTLTPSHRHEHYWRIKQAMLALRELRELKALPLLAELIKSCPDLADEALLRFDIPQAWEILEQ